MATKTLVIGDIQGHYYRLRELLYNCKIISDCPDCEGKPNLRDYCPECDNHGVTVANKAVGVLALGDVVDLGSGYTSKPIEDGIFKGKTLDFLTIDAVKKWGLNMLWGNHDWAVVHDREVSFSGYCIAPETEQVIKELDEESRIRVAEYIDGFLITHAGLHPAYVPKPEDFDPQTFINEINLASLAPTGRRPQRLLVRDAIQYARGGFDPSGGVLWRDAKEPLFDGVKQIFGHSSNEIVMGFNKGSYGLDVSKSRDGKLAGIFLPEEKVVEIEFVEHSNKFFT